MSGVKLEGISRRFVNPVNRDGNRFIGIDEITFEIPDGEFWVLVGPSGCGKSTLLRIIAGLETATSGKIFIGDRAVDRIPARERDVAMVFQNYALYPHMTVAENLGFGLQMRGVDKLTSRARVLEVAKLLELDRLLDRQPSQLSGGQQQRVALGRAIARSPQVFLLDEPLSNLDAGLRDATRTELKQLHQQMKITTIYVTHDRVEAMTLADRIVVLDRGYIQQIATPQVIYDLPANQMVATFIGTPPMNIIPASYRDRRWQFGCTVLPCPAAVASHLNLGTGREFNLGIRPEDLAIVPDSATAGVSVTVRVIEPLGRETLLKAQIHGTNIDLDLLAPADWRGQVGDTLTVQPDLDRLFVFDPTTGDRLYPS